jgi:hypothetical protein
MGDEYVSLAAKHVKGPQNVPYYMKDLNYW